MPASVQLKDPKQFKIIGKPVKRLDSRAKSTGKQNFGIDVKQPDMVYAVLTRCPVFGGKVASFDASKTKAVPGVKDVVQISNGVAVIADNTWSAMQGRKVLDIKWDEGPNANQSTRRHHAHVLRVGREARRQNRTQRRRRHGRAGLGRRRRWKRCTKRRSNRTLRWSR